MRCPRVHPILQPVGLRVEESHPHSEVDNSHVRRGDPSHVLVLLRCRHVHLIIQTVASRVEEASRTLNLTISTFGELEFTTFLRCPAYLLPISAVVELENTILR